MNMDMIVEKDQLRDIRTKRMKMQRGRTIVQIILLLHRHPRDESQGTDQETDIHLNPVLLLLPLGLPGPKAAVAAARENCPLVPQEEKKCDSKSSNIWVGAINVLVWDLKRRLKSSCRTRQSCTCSSKASLRLYIVSLPKLESINLLPLVEFKLCDGYGGGTEQKALTKSQNSASTLLFTNRAFSNC